MISIIIPIYNKASALERCLNSMRDQTYSDIEVLMINDGSSDDSESICKRFEEDDKRFKYIYQKNAGVSAARNTGLCNMQGEFFTFVDGDDWIEPDYCAELLKKAGNENSDAVFCGINYWTNGVKSPQKETAFAYIIQNRRVEHFLIGHKEYALGSSCRVLFRREKFDALRFDEHLHIYEDLIFLLTALSFTDKISFVPECLYNYDLPEVGYFSKYYRKDIFDVCYNVGNKLYGLLMQFGYDDWAKAELFKEYVMAVDWLCVTEKDKTSMFKKLKSHALIKEFCVKENYDAYKKLYSDKRFKSSIKAWLLYGKHFKAYMFCKNLRKKQNGMSNG